MFVSFNIVKKAIEGISFFANLSFVANFGISGEIFAEKGVHDSSEIISETSSSSFLPEELGSLLDFESNT